MLKELLTETYNKKLVIVDVQPEYEKYISFDIHAFFAYIREFDNILYLYNGQDTLGMCSEGELKEWILEKMDYDEEYANFLEYNVTFYDKGYAFFRYCMDSGIDDESIARIVRFMYKNNITDSRDLNDILWKKMKGKYSNEAIRELLEYADDCINVPDLMNELKDINGQVLLVGGGVNECLKEVEIALLALKKKYSIIKKWSY